MTDRDRRPEGQYGFARGSRVEQARLPGPDRLARSEEEDTPSASAFSARQRQPKAVPASAAPEPDSKGWVVRPKKPQSVAVSAPTTKLSLRKRRGPAFIARGLPAAAPARDSGFRSKSWLVIGLVGMVYLVGIAGLWSMVRTFDDAAPSTFTPATDEGTLPPLDDTVDVRDAHLDAPFMPQFRPQAPFDIGRDVAGSGFQNQI